MILKTHRLSGKRFEIFFRASDMVNVSGPPSGAIRNKPISEELNKILKNAASLSGITDILIISGGQDSIGEGTRRTGSTRHDLGRAADIQCKIGSRTLKFSNQSSDPELVSFLKLAAAAGASGIGAATDYMGPKTIHIGFGVSIFDKSRLTWGKNGASNNSPEWLRHACYEGWEKKEKLDFKPNADKHSNRYLVIARNGLRLRNGPGSNFDVDRIISFGTTFNLVSLDENNLNWARIDLEGDGLIDGYVHCGFIAPFDENSASEYVLEPEENSE